LEEGGLGDRCNLLIIRDLCYGTSIDPMPMFKPYFMKQMIPYTPQDWINPAGITKRRNTKAAFLRLFFALAAIAFLNIQAYSQNCPTSGTQMLSGAINTYFPGQASISAGATSISLGAAGAGTNFGATPIAIGDVVLIIQMQGAQIAYTNNSLYGRNITGFGTGYLSTGLSAGRMEFAFANNAVPIGGGTLNLVSGTTYAYTSSAFSTYGQYTFQVIRVPTYYNITLSGAITTPLWNGSTGGVNVINAVNQLNFNSKTISGVGAGFRGGGGRVLGGGGGNKTDYVTLSTTNTNGSKGEGMAGTPAYVNDNGSLLNTGVEGYPSGSYGRGAPGNAGGGGTDYDPSSNDQNDGGGGGANGGVGGKGGNGWFLVGTSGGKGGSDFSADVSPARLIMGGGGGAGTTNNATGSPGAGFASSGAAGGGMVIISALSVTGTGTINVSGSTANSTVTNDASGGGGAGGSILIYANSGLSGVTAIANGGDGGSNNPLASGATQHGPGGGGGGGVIFSNAAVNVASTANAGSAGISTGTNATDNFGAINGTVGILTQTFPFSQLPPNMQKCQTTILPVTLLSFNAVLQSSNNVLVSWSTANEVNTNYFEVERSEDAVNFTTEGQVSANRSAESKHNYSLTDYLSSVHSSIVYYRLKMVDIDGNYSYGKVVAINLDQADTKISIYPNPASDYAVLKLYSEKQTTAMMRLMDDAGKQIVVKSINVSRGNNNIVLDQMVSLPKGVYFVQVIMNNNLYNEKLMKR